MSTAGDAQGGNLRQTRRNTATVTSNQVMDPWKDDRLRDFIAINVQTRLRSFHLPQGADLADVGELNRQRVGQLLILGRTTARCSGVSGECPVRRIFNRIFGPSLLHHDQHATQMDVATPLARMMKSGDRLSSSPAPKHDNEESSIDDALSLATRRSLQFTEDPVLGANLLPASTCDNDSSLSASRPSPSLANTNGSATPADYRADLDCRCCNECIDAMCSHYQGLLTRGVIFDRFSQKDLLFAHWVLFRQMEGPPIDGHSSMGRREALSIQVKSGYYDLLKVQVKVEESSIIPDSPPAPAVTHVVESRKRERSEPASEKHPQPLSTDLRDSYLRDVSSKTYVTRRSLGNKDATVGLPSSTNSPAATPSIIRKKDEETMAPPPTLAISRSRKRASSTKPVVPPIVAKEPDVGIKVEAPRSRRPATPATATTTVATATRSNHGSSTSTPTVATTIQYPPKTERPTSQPPTQAAAVAKPNVVITRQQRARQREEEGALQVLLGKDVVHATSIIEACQQPSAAAVTLPSPLVLRVPPASATAPITDLAVMTRAATVATEIDPLRQYTFSQQCLLLLAASRMINPNVAQGSRFKRLNSNIPRRTLDYWDPQVSDMERGSS